MHKNLTATIMGGAILNVPKTKQTMKKLSRFKLTLNSHTIIFEPFVVVFFLYGLNVNKFNIFVLDLFVLHDYFLSLFFFFLLFLVITRRITL